MKIDKPKEEVESQEWIAVPTWSPLDLLFVQYLSLILSHRFILHYSQKI